jgi:hypothetical protein
MIRLFAAALFAIFITAPAVAQVPPYVYPVTVGTSSAPVLPINPLRKKILIHNPNDTAKIAVCPIGPNRTAHSSQALIVAAINGAGCVTLLPYDRYEVTGGTPSGPQQDIRSGFVGVASSPASALTIIEWE